jgi:2-hydroxy-6-oxonona-2,4-dienedioate hydrolase
MPDVTVNGGVVAYELLGPDDGQAVVLTPGGRFSKDVPGLRPLAQALADGGKRVLLWDRPNTGRSDIQLFGETESHMRASTLGAVVDQLGLGPVVALGGSGGARDSIVFALLHPEMVTKLGLWNIVGGPFSSMNLAGVYNMPELRTIRSKGIEGIFTMPGVAGSWPDLIAANPRNRDRLEDLGAEEFERVMTRWFNAFIPKPNEPVPGVPDWMFEQISVPTLIIRGGEFDYDHPKRTSFEVHCLIQGSRVVDPPWPEDAWERASEASQNGTGNLFDPWVKAAPVLLDFINEPIH